jgi:hypothetical protein
LYDRVRASEAEAQRKHAEMMQKRRR